MPQTTPWGARSRSVETGRRGRPWRSSARSARFGLVQDRTREPTPGRDHARQGSSPATYPSTRGPRRRGASAVQCRGTAWRGAPGYRRTGRLPPRPPLHRGCSRTRSSMTARTRLRCLAESSSLREGRHAVRGARQGHPGRARVSARRLGRLARWRRRRDDDDAPDAAVEDPGAWGSAKVVRHARAPRRGRSLRPRCRRSVRRTLQRRARRVAARRTLVPLPTLVRKSAPGSAPCRVRRARCPLLG